MLPLNELALVGMFYIIVPEAEEVSRSQNKKQPLMDPINAFARVSFLLSPFRPSRPVPRIKGSLKEANDNSYTTALHQYHGLLLVASTVTGPRLK